MHSKPLESTISNTLSSAADMHPFFQIHKQDIQSLTDGQARELVARLCQAELKENGLSPAFVTWGGDQRAKDGGVDVRVDVSPAHGCTGYLPKDSTAFQVKAESFGPAKIPAEMAPSGLLRSAITELGEQNGAYIIASTKDDLSDSSLKTRKQAIAKCLAEHGLSGKVDFDFYDCRKLADWVENFPALVVWLKHTLGQPIHGWQPYGPWAYYETDVENEYLLDSKIKVRVPNSEDGIDTSGAIDRLRGELLKRGTSARIVGLSGVGKTRFAQALFDERILTASGELNPQNVLYTDLSHNPTPQPIAMLEALKQAGSDSIVIVDNCGQGVHQQLTEIVKQAGCKLRLLTVEYDIRDDLPEGTSCYHLDGASDEIITKLIRRRYQQLSDVDISKIVEFSGGNARVAFALASTSESKGELAQLKDRELFDRLFLQKNSVNDELQRCAEVASLLYSFDSVDISANSELALLSGLAEVSVTTFFRNTSELQKRGLIQERGKWRAVLPHAISNRLALEAIQKYPTPLLLRQFVTNSTERIARSFSRRLGYLHESQAARDIAQDWLSPNGILGDVSNHTDFQRQMFGNIAPLNQRAALNAILQCTNDTSFLSVSNRNRAHYTRLLRSLAYESDLFEDAANGLLSFALEEPEDHRSDPTREKLKSLFFIYLSGTLSLPAQRAGFVRKLVSSPNEFKQRLGFELLKASLTTHHFSSHDSFEFGALKRGFGWYPESREEVQSWYELFIKIAIEIGCEKSPSGISARQLLGRGFRGLWSEARMHELLAQTTQKFALIDGWPDGWIGIRRTIQLDKSKFDAAALVTLTELEKTLMPGNLKAEIQAKVLVNGDFIADIEADESTETTGKKLRRAEDEIKRLGNLAAYDPSILSDLNPYFQDTQSNSKIFSFAFGIGEAATSCTAIFNQLKIHFLDMVSNRPNTVFIRGLVAGWGASKPKDVGNFLDDAVSDDVFGQVFPELQLCIPLDDKGYSRLLKSMALGKAPSRQYRYLSYGRATDALTVEQIDNLLSALAAKPDDGLHAAFDVLHMVIFGSDTKDHLYKTALRTFCMKFIGAVEWTSLDLHNENLMHEVKEVIEYGFTDANSNLVAASALLRLVENERNSELPLPSRLGELLLPFFKICPIAALDACYFQDMHGSYHSALRMLTVGLGRNQSYAVSAVPDSDLINWCNQSPTDRFLFAAQTCKLFDGLSPHDENVTGIASSAVYVLWNAPAKKRVIDIFLERFSPSFWSGSRAAILRARLGFLDQLKSTEDAALNALIAEAKSRFSLVLNSEQAREESEERSQTGSFE